MSIVIKLFRACILVPFLLFSFKPAAENEIPIVEILSPQKGAEHLTAESVSLKLNIISEDCNIFHDFTKADDDGDLSLDRYAQIIPLLYSQMAFP